MGPDPTGYTWRRHEPLHDETTMAPSVSTTTNGRADTDDHGCDPRPLDAVSDLWDADDPKRLLASGVYADFAVSTVGGNCSADGAADRDSGDFAEIGGGLEANHTTTIVEEIARGPVA